MPTVTASFRGLLGILAAVRLNRTLIDFAATGKSALRLRDLREVPLHRQCIFGALNAPWRRAMALVVRTAIVRRRSCGHRRAWSNLPRHIRDAILTLVEAGMPSANGRPSANTLGDDNSGDDLAWRLARRCREVVQTCFARG